MQTPVIGYLAPRADDAAAAERRLNAIAEAWPAGSPRPRTALATVAAGTGGGDVTLIERTSGENADVAPAAWTVAVFDPDLPGGDVALAQTIDRLIEAHVPILRLCGTPGAACDSGDGSMIDFDITAGEEALAATIWTLSQRQPAVRSLASAMRLIQSSQGEAADTLDRMNEELLIAAKVQRDFLPDKLPASDHLSAAVLYRPAGIVSGDIYDVVQLDDRYTAFFMADAMGHGVPAALMTLFMTRSVPTRREGANADPATSLAKLNQEMAASRAGPTRFSTAVCGVIDTQTGHVRFASAGHPPLIAVGPQGIRFIEATGLLLGVLPDTEYEIVEFTLEAGETLLVHSDGLDDALRTHPDPIPEGGPPSHPRLAYLSSLVADGNPLAPTNAVRDIAHLLDSMSGSLNPLDDVTVMAFSLPLIAAAGDGPTAAAPMSGRAAA